MFFTDLITAISTLVLAVIAMLALSSTYFIRKQLDLTRKEKSLQFSFLTNPHIREARKYLNSTLGADWDKRGQLPMEEIEASLQKDDQIRLYITVLLSHIQQIATALELKIIDEDTIFYLASWSTVNYYEIFNNFIMLTRQGMNSSYLQEAEILVDNWKRRRNKGDTYIDNRQK